MRTLRLPTALAALALAAATAGRADAQATPAADSAGHYAITRRLPVGGEGGWDYLSVDTVGNRLFITRSDRVVVVDPASGSVVGEIPGLHRGHGVAFAYPYGHGFVTSGTDSTVTMFDLKTLAVLGTTTAADDADAILYDAASKRVFSMNGDANSTTVINPITGKRVRNVALGGKPEFGVSDGRGHVYVNLEDKAQVVELDSKALRVMRRWALGACEEPSGLAIDTANGLLFSGCRNKLMAVSSIARGAIVTTVPIGEGVDANAFDPTTHTAFSSNGEGSLTVVREDSPTTFTVVDSVATMRGARTMALDPRTHTVYTVSAQFGEAPAAATPDNPRRRAPMVPGTFTVLVLERR